MTCIRPMANSEPRHGDAAYTSGMLIDIVHVEDRMPDSIMFRFVDRKAKRTYDVSYVAKNPNWDAQSTISVNCLDSGYETTRIIPEGEPSQVVGPPFDGEYRD